MPSPRLSKDAQETVSKMQHKHAKQVLLKIIALCQDPIPNDSKVLHGSSEGFMRVDSGEYRIIYRIDEYTLYIAAIGKRNDDEVYKRFVRK